MDECISYMYDLIKCFFFLKKESNGFSKFFGFKELSTIPLSLTPGVLYFQLFSGKPTGIS